MLQAWLDNWNDRVKDWVVRGAPRRHGRLPDVTGCSTIVDGYAGGTERTALDADALPEPYVGDPLRDDLDGVIITLNPAGSNAAQKHPAGDLVNDIRNGKKYYDLASNWRLAPETLVWWEKRSQFCGRTLGDAEPARSRETIVGIDLVPFHSEDWGGLTTSKSVSTWLRDEVFLPVAAISQSTRMARLLQDGAADEPPLVLGIGKAVRVQLQAVGFDIRFQLSKSSRGGLQWPSASPSTPNKPASRVLTWLYSRTLRLSVLHTELSSMDAPGVGFRDILHKLVTDAKLRAKLSGSRFP